MKKFKKLAGLMLALVMVMGLSLTASAANYTITINNTTSGHTYEAYQIFEGTLSGTGSLADPYILTEIEWGSGVNTTTEVDGSTLIVALKAL